MRKGQSVFVECIAWGLSFLVGFPLRQQPIMAVPLASSERRIDTENPEAIARVLSLAMISSLVSPKPELGIRLHPIGVTMGVVDVLFGDDSPCAIGVAKRAGQGRDARGRHQTGEGKKAGCFTLREHNGLHEQRHSVGRVWVDSRQ